VLPQYVKTIKKNVPSNIRVSTIIDYPLGLSGYEEREIAVKNAINNGAQSIEMVCPNHALCNRKYDRMRLEIDHLKKLPTIYPSTSFFLDSISDNILASMTLQSKNSDLKIIVTGQAWTDKHVDMILNNDNIFAYKTTNIYTLEKISNKIRFLG
jgi:hypothetical protein